MFCIENYKKLTASFYQRDVLIVAKELLGKYFVKKDKANFLAGKIVEVEAYNGKFDSAAHTFIGKTERNKVMFENGGLLYVYFTYGNHFCCNVVTGKKDDGCAVLIRAVEPVLSVDSLYLNRFNDNNILQKNIYSVTNGPGKLCQAFGINKSHNGVNLCRDEIFILNERKIPDKNIVQTTRIGIKKSIELPWRFFINNNPYVSKK